MKAITWERFAILATVSVACMLAGCGGGSPPPGSPPVTVSVNPSIATLNQGAARQFAAAVTGSANTGVTWSVQEPAGGFINSAGLYTAPATVGTFHVVATSQADPTKIATAIVTVVQTPASGPVAVSISPSSVTMAQGGSWLFVPEVTGTINMSVTWSVQEPAGGSVTHGFYTSPNTAGTFHVIATSQADITKLAVATVTVVPTSAGRFGSTGRMATARVYHTATRLLDGRVLVAGGMNEVNATFFKLSSAELFDPATGTFSQTGAMNHPRGSHTATLLSDGTVMIAGGFDASGPVATAEIFNPATGTFGQTGGMQVARFRHTATKLINNTVLISGGTGGNNSALDAAEIYDPAKGSFASVGQMRIPRVLHSASLLPNGQVLLAGGFTSAIGGQATSSAELYDPSMGTFFVTGNMISPRVSFVAAALLDGTVLVAGGDGLGSVPSEVYDPGPGSFFANGVMNAQRGSFTAVTLQDGTVLLCGGPFPGSFLAELYRPGTAVFEATGSMTWDRSDHTATLLADGRVLVIGGWGNDSVILDSAELYTP